MIDPQFQQQHEFVRCKYPSKVCYKMRSRKRNGQLHRFCEDHRTKANLNQKRWSAARVKHWDALAHPLGHGLEVQETDMAAPPVCVKTEPHADGFDKATCDVPMLSVDDCDYDYDYAFDSHYAGDSLALSWQDTATEELREFLGDLLLSMGSDDLSLSPPPPPAAFALPFRW